MLDQHIKGIVVVLSCILQLMVFVHLLNGYVDIGCDTARRLRQSRSWGGGKWDQIQIQLQCFLQLLCRTFGHAAIMVAIFLVSILALR